jgi:hypothetical protein
MVPATRVAFSFQGQAIRSGQWAVIDDGHTLETRALAEALSSWDAVTDTYWGESLPIETQQAGQAPANARAS